MANVKSKEKKIKVQAMDVATIPGVVEDAYSLQFGNDNVKVFVVKTTGKRISGTDGMLGEISAQAVTDTVAVKSNGKGWNIPANSILVAKGDITRKVLHCYGGKLSSKKLIDVIVSYEAARAYYTFFDSGYDFSSNISLNEKVFEWMETYSAEANVSIGYVISAIAAHDKTTLSYAKKFMKKLRKEGVKTSDLAADIAEVEAELADLTDDAEIILEG